MTPERRLGKTDEQSQEAPREPKRQAVKERCGKKEREKRKKDKEKRDKEEKPEQERERQKARKKRSERAALNQAEPKELDSGPRFEAFPGQAPCGRRRRAKTAACLKPANPLLWLRFAQEKTTSKGARRANRAPGPAGAANPADQASASPASARGPLRRDFPKRFRPFFSKLLRCSARAGKTGRPLVARPRLGLGEKRGPKKKPAPCAWNRKAWA